MASSCTLGIDPAKRKLTAALLSPEETLLLRPTDFAAGKEVCPGRPRSNLCPCICPNSARNYSGFVWVGAE